MSKTRPPKPVTGLVIGTTLGGSTASDAMSTEYTDNTNFMVSVTNKQNATSITIQVQWSVDQSVWAAQRTGGTPSSGVSTIEAYSETEALTGPVNIPVSYPTNGWKWCRLLISMNNVTPMPTVTAVLQRG